jgi:signal transduction histidine kinase
MAQKKLPPQKHLILADLVKSWASRNRVTTDPYINGLMRALTELKGLAMWASIDALVYLPHPVATGEQEIRRIYNRLNAFRNALVFAPVALTWYAVGQATSAFKEFVDKNAAATVNFLEFWQNGYDVLPREWRISNVALFDFLIVLSVIVLTVISNILSGRSDRRLVQEELEIEQERTELALAIKEYLHSHQNLTRATLNAGVATAIENLVQATENIQQRTAAKRRKKR